MEDSTREAIQARMTWHKREIQEAERKIRALQGEMEKLRASILIHEGGGKEDLELLSLGEQETEQETEIVEVE